MSRKDIIHAVALGAAWVAAVLLLIHLLIGPHGLPANRRLEAHLSALEAENRRLEAENERLWEEIRYRQSDVYLEELIRTEFRQVTGDEVMVIFPTPSPTPLAVSGPSAAHNGVSRH